MANIEDILTIAIVLFVVGTATLFIVKAGHDINDNLKLVPTFNNSAEATALIDHADVALNSSDYIYLGLFIAFFLGLIITAWFVGGTAILAPIYFFILIIFTFVSVIIQKVWDDISAQSDMITTVAQLPITNFILGHLGYFVAIFGIVSIIVMFAKPTEAYQ